MSIEALLCRWGRWALRQDDHGLGYPRHVSYCRDAAASFAFVDAVLLESITDQDSALVDKAISTLPPTLQALAIARYQHNLSLRRIARDAGWSHQTTRNRLDQIRLLVQTTLDKGVY